MRKLAFTIIEILIVLLILGVLIAILVPVISSSLKKSKESACLSNIKQVGLAMKLYLQDNDDLYPPYGAGESEKILGYVVKKANVSSCPIVTTKENDSKFVPGFASNALLHGFAPITSPTRDSLILSPSSTVQIVEINGTDAVTSWLAGFEQQRGRRHHGGGNVLLCDGHARWYDPSQIRGVGEGTNGSQPAFDFDRARWQDEPISKSP